MPQYRVTGKGSATGRKRARTYTAASESAARDMAKADGTVVEQVERLPDEQATEAQIEYANDLGIEYEPDISKEEMSALISARLDYNPLPDLQRLAKAHRTARIVYKKTDDERPSTRTVEPYSMEASGVRQAAKPRRVSVSPAQVVIRCYQLSPKPSGDPWRTFRLDRIVAVNDAGRKFKPRMPVTLHAGIADAFVYGEDRRPMKSQRSGCLSVLVVAIITTAAAIATCL